MAVQRKHAQTSEPRRHRWFSAVCVHVPFFSPNPTPPLWVSQFLFQVLRIWELVCFYLSALKQKFKPYYTSKYTKIEIESILHTMDFTEAKVDSCWENLFVLGRRKWCPSCRHDTALAPQRFPILVLHTSIKDRVERKIKAQKRFALLTTPRITFFSCKEF